MVVYSHQRSKNSLLKSVARGSPHSKSWRKKKVAGTSGGSEAANQHGFYII
jgi:hypothetical protein